ncbi:protein adenylyltransferase SelO family protein [uncultured Alteromonas sp.]|jgi:uncharacterized protein YdiU (UPF0061 family)|uniref:protein adenylyltransferase SelO family protein n=1 Tax=uncultured Alteromonas sp. TaxID=179113 RepID=UPI0025D34E68|nr:protein adenylyltransferase SelO family protein [uncultured Alteromonas sp.]
MPDQASRTAPITSLSELADCADYSFLTSLNPDPQATSDGYDHQPRQVYSGHYVPVLPMALKAPGYVAHSQTLFRELGLDDNLAGTEAFVRLFSGDMTNVPPPMRKTGWATGYALSIYGTEYTQQCPFGTGNGYGDGRALSVFEGLFNGKRWEMQLKGAGRTPYCRGADGRAVLRSSVREFLAQEHMHALGVPSSRSLCLMMSQSETVNRPWYYQGSSSFEPEVMVANPVAITTRVAPSFIRVGQLELFARRARSQQHPDALAELQALVAHLIEREYALEIDTSLSLPEQVIQLAEIFQERLTSLVANWIRVGYCQGNFNSDNCAAGGYTLDYGPFGFCELFDPLYQPWTGGGRHFSFFNQTAAAEKNFSMFCGALAPLIQDEPDRLNELDAIRGGFAAMMEHKLGVMWASKLGLQSYNAELVMSLLQLMVRTSVDYTMLFRELCCLPDKVTAITRCFYQPADEALQQQWNDWLTAWHEHLDKRVDNKEIARRMKQVNPKYTWREWLVVPAYTEAEKGNFTLLKALQNVLTNPYDEQSADVETTYYCLRPAEYFDAGGISHYSCSS